MGNGESGHNSGGGANGSGVTERNPNVDDYYPRIEEHDLEKLNAFGDARRASGTKKKLINVALQGGGSHGAFTWGVLDRLLEDGRFEIEAISGTSAGAMNAAALADGFVRGAENGARERLTSFWKAVSEASKYSIIQRAPLDVLMGNWTLDTSPGFLLFDALNKIASPYEFNPLNLNPLRDLLEQSVDFGNVRNCERPLVFISATNVENGRVKVFNRAEITADVIMASACLPFVFKAVEIDGVPYWDGGYMGNPVLFPFHDTTKSSDYVIIQINPVFRKGAPKTAREIMNRLDEISFNASLMQELRSIDFVKRLIEDKLLDESLYKRVNIHTIAAHEEIAPLGASSKFNAEWAFLQHLFDIGRRAADKWINEAFDMIGVKDTADVRDMYQGHGAPKKTRYVTGLR
jgi:NTE family protein